MAAQTCKVSGCPHIACGDTYFCKQRHRKEWVESPERGEFFAGLKDDFTPAERDYAYEVSVADFCIRLKHQPAVKGA